jgi:hypothetical protein
LSLTFRLAVDDISKLRQIFEQQFSLEILLKNEERRIIEAEKAKVETAIKQLEQSVAAGGLHNLSIRFLILRCYVS